MQTASDVDTLLGRIRDLTARYKAGDRASFGAFRDLASFLLSLTVMRPEGGVRLAGSRDRPDRFILGGWGGPTDPVPLNDGRYLRVSVTLDLTDTPDGRRLKVFESAYQYQRDREGDQWVFRYDYLRHPPEPHPGAHLQIRGKLSEGRFFSLGRPLERLHFPTGRISLEAVIRLLAEEFHVPCNEPAEVWRPVLAESERAFLEIAHRPLAGPEL